MPVTRRRKPPVPLETLPAFPVSEYVRRRLSIGSGLVCTSPASAADYRAAARDADWTPQTKPANTHLYAPQTDLKSPPVSSIQNDLKVAQEGSERALKASESDGVDTPTSSVYDAELLVRPEDEPHGYFWIDTLPTGISEIPEM